MGLKNLFSKAKSKLNEAVEKGNSGLTKFSNTKNVTFYSSPVIGGFLIKKAFYEDDRLLFPKENFKPEDIKVHAIIGLNEDQEYYVITNVSETLVTKEVSTGGKTYTYSCYEVFYSILNDEFTNDVEGLPFYELTEKQHKALDQIKLKIEAKSLANPEKKEFVLNLWQYVTECIGYQLKEHYIMLCFAKIANEYVDDFSTYLIQLFA